MGIKLFDSERRVMEVLWQRGDTTAREIALQLADIWNKNTTYTVIKKCIAKGAVERREPNFLCHALIGREESREQAAAELVHQVFEGSASLLFASLLSGRPLPAEEIDELKRLIEELR